MALPTNDDFQNYGTASKMYVFSMISPCKSKGDVMVDDGTNVQRLAVGSNGQALLADSTQTLGAKWAFPGATAVMFDLKANGTFGGPATGSSTYDTRVLNTLLDPCSLITSLSSNVFTVTNAGTYLIRITCPTGANVGNSKARLYNVTGGAAMTDIGGNTVNSSGPTSAVNGAIQATISSIITVTAGQQFRVEHSCATHTSNNDFGVAVSDGSTEIYSQVTLTRLI